MHTSPGIRATSYHRDVYSLRGKLAVQRVFPRAWHLLHDDGRILTVTTAPYNGPLAILLARPRLDDLPIEPGMHASLQDNTLLLGPLTISLAPATPWSPCPPGNAPPLSFSALHRDLHLAAANLSLDTLPLRVGAGSASAGRTQSGGPLRAASSSSPSPARGRGGRGVRVHLPALLEAIQTRNPSDLEHHTSSLIGLGPGLTPAGDDILTGLLAGLFIFNHRSPAPSHCASTLAILTDIVERLAPNRTTALSQTLLLYATRGIAVEPLLDVLWTLGTGGPIRGLGTLLAIGHTSGSDMLTGALLAARALLHWTDPIGSRPVGAAPCGCPPYKEHHA